VVARSLEESAPGRSRSFRVRLGAPDVRVAHRAGEPPDTDLGGPLDIPGSDRRPEHPHRSDLEHAGISIPMDGPQARGATGYSLRPTAADRRRAPVARSLRPSGRSHGVSARSAEPRRAVDGPARGRIIPASPRCARDRRVRLVAGGTTGPARDRLHAGPTLQRSHSVGQGPGPVVWLERSDGGSAVVLRRRYRLPPGIRRGREAIRTVRRGLAARRGLRAPLGHADGAYEPGRSDPRVSGDSTGGFGPRPDPSRADALGDIQAHRRAPGRAALPGVAGVAGGRIGTGAILPAHPRRDAHAVQGAA
jgi:hypothetical protein